MVERRVTKIESQKKQKNRFSIFLDGEFAFGVSGDVLSAFRIKEGTSLSENDIQNILKREDERKATLQAFRYLAIRDHSEQELATKLKKKGFAESTISNLLENLKNKQFVNDRIYAFRFARDRIVSRPMGRKQLMFELKKKGLHEDLIQEVVEAIYSEFDEVELAKKLAEKKLKNLKDESVFKKKEKIARFLASRGFTWDIISGVFSELELTSDGIVGG